MAHNQWIYLIYNGVIVISAHTVKKDAHDWLAASIWTPENTKLCQMRDGVAGGTIMKEDREIPWEF